MGPLSFSVAAGGQVKVTESLGQQPERESMRPPQVEMGSSDVVVGEPLG